MARALRISGTYSLTSSRHSAGNTPLAPIACNPMHAQGRAWQMREIAPWHPGEASACVNVEPQAGADNWVPDASLHLRP